MKICLISLCLLLFSNHRMIQVSTDSSYAQNFNGLPLVPVPWMDNSTLISWYAPRSDTGTSLTLSNGTATTGDLCNYGSTIVPADRSLGSLGSGNVTAGNFVWGVLLQNNTGLNTHRNSITITYTGEEWRNSASAAQSISFHYKRSASTISGLGAILSKSEAGSTLIYLTDILGKMIRSWMSAGGGIQMLLDIHDIQAGIYLLSLSSGLQKESIKWAKQ